MQERQQGSCFVLLEGSDALVELELVLLSGMQGSVAWTASHACACGGSLCRGVYWTLCVVARSCDTCVCTVRLSDHGVFKQQAQCI